MALGIDVPVFGRAAIGNADLPRMLTGGIGTTPLAPPWSRTHLESQAVSPRFIAYLERFDRLVEGGAVR
jgi:hypothetical protein